jgi:hypothetical protein
MILTANVTTILFFEEENKLDKYCILVYNKIGIKNQFFSFNFDIWRCEMHHYHFTKFATHHETDSDELTGMFLPIHYDLLLSKHEALSVEFFDAGTRTPDGKPVEKWMSEGYCPVGIWGSLFDEHRNGSRPRRFGECAATLMGKYLGVSEDPAIKSILKYILECDYGNRPYQADGLSVLVKTLHWYYPDDPLMVMYWFFDGLSAKYGDSVCPDNFSLDHIFSRMLSLGYKDANEWYELAKDAMAAQKKHFETVTPLEFLLGTDGVVHQVSGPYGKVNVAVVRSDDKFIKAYSTKKIVGRCGVCIQQKSSGHIQIFSDKHQGIFLDNVVPIIRTLEMAARGKHNSNPSSLYWEGSVFGSESWCSAHRIFMLNGSNTTRNVKPTKLSLEQVFEGVCEGLAVKSTPIKKHKQHKKIAA